MNNFLKQIFTVLTVKNVLALLNSFNRLMLNFLCDTINYNNTLCFILLSVDQC